jgi:alpha-glucan, water dikinase
VYQPAECDQETEGSMEELQELLYDLEFRTASEDDLILHWGLSYNGKSGWVCPPNEIHPEGTKVFDQKAVQTLFSPDSLSVLKTIKLNIAVNLENNIQGINWVFNVPSKNKWFNNNNKDYSLKFKTIKKKTHLHGGDQNIPEFVEDIIKCEMEYGSWTLMHRYNKCFDVLNEIDLDNENLIWIYIWLRYNYIRVLDWQRKFNTRPRELAYSMNRLTQDITNKICSYLKNNKQENEKFELNQDVLMRMFLSVLGKGTGDGQKIRDEILVILHKHHIKETNDHFYEQWHQKLHNNTTPDDIPICEAVIAYLRSGGKMEVYWKVLNNYGVSKERLANFERKIISEPFYKPELIPDLENFLKTLKAVHSSDDMILMFDSAKYALQGSDFMKFQDIINNKDHWDTLKQIERVTEGRQSLSKIILGSLHDTGRVRDLIFFDLCLETYFRQCVEKIIHLALEFEHYITEITAIVKNLNITYKFRELRICLEDWVNICEVLKKNLQNKDKSNKAVISALKIKSVADRMSRTLTHIIDYFNTHYDPKARYLGNAFNAEKYIVDIFTEETIRGSILFTLSMVLKKIEPILRSTANLGAWLIISRGKTLEPGKEMVRGNVSYVKSLQEVQFKNYEKPTILITEQVGGNEEVPPNVTCLIILNAKDYPDVLAHVSVRARNLGVPFLVCFDENISNNLRKYEKKYIALKIVKQGLDIVEDVPPVSNGANKIDSTYQDSDEREETKQIQSVNIPEGFPKIIIHMSEFSKQYVGAKSNNTQKVFGNLPSWVKYPESMAIPFNVCEYFLEFEENSHIKEKLEALSKSLKTEKNSKISELLFECKKSLMTLTFIDNEETKLLKSELAKFGIKETVTK